LVALIKLRSVYLYLVFVWLALLAIVGYERWTATKRPQGNSVTVIPAIIS